MCVCVCVWARICIYMCVYIYIYIYTYVYIYTHMSVWVCEACPLFCVVFLIFPCVPICQFVNTSRYQYVSLAWGRIYL